MGGLVILLLLLLAGVSLCWLGIFLSLPASATELPSAYAEAEAAQEVDGGINAPSPDGSYPITPAEEVQQTDKRPISAPLLTMLLLVIVSLGAIVLWMLMSNALSQGAICSWDVVRASSTTSCEEPSVLAVFLL
jgi:hypothetical protein